MECVRQRSGTLCRVMTGHGSGASSCELRVYIYDNLLPALAHQLTSARAFLDADCLGAGNDSDSVCAASEFSWRTIRQYSSDGPIYDHFANACPRTKDPSSADVFVVPFLFGWMMVSGWLKRPANGAHVLHASRSAIVKEHDRMVRAALSIQNGSLVHLNNSTARRHVFLFS